jgi:hypothetical protein
MMDRVVAIIDSFNVGHWIAIFAIIVGSFFGSFTVANFLAGRRERKLRTYETTPEVKATINRKRYVGDWRSVQLHIVEGLEAHNFKFENWHIQRARLLRPWRGAVLARAENDDYAIGVFYPDKSTRVLMGKAEGRPQRFALEFFIKFKGIDRGKGAKFEVAFEHVKKRRPHIIKVWALVPWDAE